MDVFRGFASWVVLNPDTGYLPFGDISHWFIVNRGCLGITNALVCLSSDRSLHRADINGRSMFLLFSRRMFMSIVLGDGVVAAVVGEDEL